MSWRYAADVIVCVNLLVGMPHTLRRVVFPGLPLRPLCLPSVRMSVKSSRSTAITDTSCCLAHLTSWLTASRRPPRR